MNGRTTKIIRRYCLATGAPERHVRKLVESTPRQDRGKALAALKAATVTPADENHG